MLFLQKIVRQFWVDQKEERSFIFMAMLCSFCISCDYAIVRPVSNSVFLSFFSSSYLPYLWLSGVPINFVLVSLYNRYLPKLGCWTIFLIAACCISSINLLGAFYLKQSPIFSILHFIWKEIYVLLLFQMLWSLIHMTLSIERAKSLYGPMFGIGGVGSLLGSFIPGSLALRMGSESLLFFSFPILILLGCLYRRAIFYSAPLKTHVAFHKGGGTPSSIQEGIRLIGNSKILLYILLLVIFMQLASTLLDYEFNAFLQQVYPDKNLRTAYLGKLGSVIGFFTLFLQFVGSSFLIHVIGVRGTHFSIPLLLGVNSILALVKPGLKTMTFSFASIKVLDFSLFSIVKEMLYIKLSPQEKFQAKAVIDIFAYRGAKALAAFLILGLHYVGVPSHKILLFICVCVFLVWAFVLRSLFYTTEQKSY